MTKQYGQRKDWQNDPRIKTIDDAMNNSDLGKALIDIEDAIKHMSDPEKNAHAWTHKGVILYRQRDYAGARNAFVKATDVNDNDSDAIYCLAEMDNRGL
jgi:Flp pilus assembly protein TadD